MPKVNFLDENSTYWEQLNHSLKQKHSRWGLIELTRLMSAKKIIAIVVVALFAGVIIWANMGNNVGENTTGVTAVQSASLQKDLPTEERIPAHWLGLCKITRPPLCAPSAGQIRLWFLMEKRVSLKWFQTARTAAGQSQSVPRLEEVRLNLSKLLDKPF